MTEVEYGIEPAPPSNHASTVALIAGLLACVPATGLIAMPAGAMGMRRANRIGGVGRASSMLGLTLGLINLAWWSALLAGALQTKLAFQKAQPAILATGKFVMLVGKGELTSAKTFCTAAVTEENLMDLAVQMGEAGSLLQPDANFGGEVHSSGDIEVQAKLTFDHGVRILVTHWDARGDQPKLSSYELMDAASTQPAGQTTQPAK